MQALHAGFAEHASACRAQYMHPPEALDGCKLGVKSNVYAFGMLIYELLLRKEPYQDEDQGVPPTKCMAA